MEEEKEKILDDLFVANQDLLKKKTEILSQQKVIANMQEEIKRLEKLMESKISHKVRDNEKYDPRINNYLRKKMVSSLKNDEKEEARDEIDVKLQEYMSKQDNSIQFIRIEEGVYSFGTRRVIIKIMNNKLVCHLGGGYMEIPEFIAAYTLQELIKMKKGINSTPTINKTYLDALRKEDSLLNQQKLQITPNPSYGISSYNRTMHPISQITPLNNSLISPTNTSFSNNKNGSHSFIPVNNNITNLSSNNLPLALKNNLNIMNVQPSPLRNSYHNIDNSNQANGGASLHGSALKQYPPHVDISQHDKKQEMLKKLRNQAENDFELHSELDSLQNVVQAAINVKGKSSLQTQSLSFDQQNAFKQRQKDVHSSQSFIYSMDKMPLQQPTMQGSPLNRQQGNQLGSHLGNNTGNTNHLMNQRMGNTSGRTGLQKPPQMPMAYQKNVSPSTSQMKYLIDTNMSSDFTNPFQSQSLSTTPKRPDFSIHHQRFMRQLSQQREQRDLTGTYSPFSKSVKNIQQLLSPSAYY